MFPPTFLSWGKTIDSISELSVAVVEPISVRSSPMKESILTLTEVRLSVVILNVSPTDANNGRLIFLTRALRKIKSPVISSNAGNAISSSVSLSDIL